MHLIEERYICPKEAGKILGLTGKTVAGKLKRGEIRGFRLGPRAWRTTASRVHAYAARLQAEQDNARLRDAA